ncbi:MAG: response regulator [Leptolyngbyaceae cyanobacterium bins.349]|nr:response regulator [Leptolyngbyaceae cyanobacterium bins.349]
MQTILLAEDNSDSVLLIQRAFRRANIPYPIQVVPDGESVILYLTGSDRYADRELYPFPSLLLLDLKIPIKSGHEVLGWLRQQPHLKRLPVVVLTSSKEISDINLAYDLGANSYLVKPVGFDNLLETIKTLHHYWNSFNQAPTMLVS